MKQIFTISAAFIIMLTIISSCKCPFKPNEPVKKLQSQTEVSVIKSFGEPEIDTSLSFTIDTASITDNILFARITYTGEKSDIRFNLVWNGVLLKSFPPKAYVYIAPEIKELRGKQTVTHDLYFDLTPMMKTEKIVILLQNYNKTL